MKLQPHLIRMVDDDLVLRPMTEADWDILLKWNSDPQVLYYADGGRLHPRTVDEVQGIYRHVSQTAFCFVAEVNGLPVGECWLQRMNLERIIERNPGQDLRRIDLMIGEKALWGKGYGTRMIRLLTWMAFEVEHADAVFGCDVADYNLRSQKAFEKAGYGLHSYTRQSPGSTATYTHDYWLTRQMYDQQQTG